MTITLKTKIYDLYNKIDIILLAMISVLMVDTIWIKPMALLLSIFWIRKINWKNSIKDLPPFYIIIVGLCMLQYFVIQDFSKEYLLFFGIGVFYWLMSIFAFTVIYSRIQNQPLVKTNNTLKWFFILNAIITAAQLGKTMYLSGSINPFSLWDVPEFGNSTGDHLKGIFLAPCYINFMANSFFAIYFFYRKELVASFFAVVILCLTSSNFAIVFFLPVYLIVIFSGKIAKAWLTALSSIAFIIVFYLVISIGNFHYLAESILKTEHHYDKTKIGKIDKTVSNNSKVTNVNDVDFFKYQKGKVIAVHETIDFLKQDWKNFLFGAGIGNFSSLLAKRQSDIQLEQKSRLFKKLPLRISKSYRDNHYTIEKHLYNLPSDWHSIQQQPASFLNQILGEYGVLGTLAFLVFYVFYILKKIRFRGPVFAIAILMGYYLLFDYLFEYLSIVLLFEVFFMIEIIKNKKNEIPVNE